MTYLEIVNAVLVRLRERSVSTWNQSTYSTMVGAFVNDAKREVEHCWVWGANRSDKTITTADGTATYEVTGMGEEAKILSFWNDTQNYRITHKSNDWFSSRLYGGASVSGSPRHYTFRAPGSTSTTLEMWPVPDGVYSCPMTVYTPQGDFTADTDALAIPARPIILQAVAMLAEEKGETGGTTSARYFAMADKALSSAIALDAERYPTEMDWYF